MNETDLGKVFARVARAGGKEEKEFLRTEFQGLHEMFVAVKKGERLSPVERREALLELTKLLSWLEEEKTMMEEKAKQEKLKDGIKLLISYLKEED